jgi:DNA (cytosine-5)-methyltransferase 1
VTRPLILDLYCCQGGASEGYVQAGFDVVGVDIVAQPRYPHPFGRADALEVLRSLVKSGNWRRYAGVHASPPCQLYSKTHRIRKNEHPDLVAPTRELLNSIDLPYVIENVPGAPLIDPVTICGQSLGLRMYRHREFETNWPLQAPLHYKHERKQVKMGRWPAEDEMLQPVGNFCAVELHRQEMGMPWANREGLREAIPPAYTKWIGSQLMSWIRTTSENQPKVEGENVIS